jgi:multidrug resistance efflux pump
MAKMDGQVVDLNLKPGQLVSPELLALSVADFSQWVVYTDNLTELEVTELEVGQAVEISLDALPDAVLTGEITHINSRYEEKRGEITYTVTILLTQTDPRMRWGMTAAVNFIP